jgi:ankyrin repeat protein
MRTFLDQGGQGNRTNVNDKNNNGQTPLHCASIWGHNEECIALARTLLDSGANMNEKK